ncbi:MAG TPA: hypothetical protein VFY85_11550 [Gemmatimonadaceae bacterium]|nr:hypothetical protein [Gemmatimonadaceae bacterium]
MVDGTEKIAYNHFDSYPSGLGTSVLGWLRKAHLGATERLARELRVVANDSEPTDEDIERLGGYLNKHVGERRERPDWYQLLRETQGNPAAILDAGVLLDAHEFPLDSLFAEWGYLVDFDNKVLEAYRGFQHGSHSRGRFASRKGSEMSPGYYPCALEHSWPLSALPTDDEFVKALEGDDE